MNGELSWSRTVTQILNAWSSTLRLSWSLFCVSIFTGATNAYMMSLLTTLNSVLEHQYGFSIRQIGWWYLAIGAGGGIGIVMVGCLSDLNVRRLGKHHVEVRPEDRLLSAILCAIVIPAGLFLYGWTAERQIHWVVPLIGASIFSAGSVGSQVRYILSTSPMCTLILFHPRSLSAHILWTNTCHLHRRL